MMKPCLHADSAGQTFRQHEQLVEVIYHGTQLHQACVSSWHGQASETDPVRQAEATRMMSVQGGLGSTAGAV